MRASIAILFAVLALWRAAVDWQATIGQGYAYRFGTFDTLLSGSGRSRTARFVARASGRAACPGPRTRSGRSSCRCRSALVLAAVAAGLWITRERRRRARW